MADTSFDALLSVLRQAEQVEDGDEDVPFEESAALECQARGWLDKEMQLTPAGRAVLKAKKSPDLL